MAADKLGANACATGSAREWGASSSGPSTVSFPNSYATSATTAAPGTVNFNVPMHSTKSTPAPLGSLSFALRTNISPAEIDLILDADSIHALDFLRLSYTAPPTLAAVITPTCLDLYDRVFKHLLRMLRMQSVVGQLWKDVLVHRRGTRLVNGRRRTVGERPDADESIVNDSILVQRFRLEATHFINTISAYTNYTAISQPWASCKTYVSELEEHIESPIPAPVTVHTPRYFGPQYGSSQHQGSKHIHSNEFTLAGLCSNHENTLKIITSALFLRKRHHKAADALESACNSILKFAKHVRVHAATGPDPDRLADSGARSMPAPIDASLESGARLHALYVEFKGHATAFAEACVAAEERGTLTVEVQAGWVRRFWPERDQLALPLQ